jgi:hypothetical protein
MPAVIPFSPGALALFGAAVSFVATANLLLFVVVGEVNRKVPEDQRVEYFLWYPGKVNRVTALYRQHYPRGRLLFYYRGCLGVAAALGLAFVWRAGFFG